MTDPSIKVYSCSHFKFHIPHSPHPLLYPEKAPASDRLPDTIMEYCACAFVLVQIAWRFPSFSTLKYVRLHLYMLDT